MDAFLGTILLWPCTRVPQNWALCDGSQIPINRNTALFSILGNIWGGDGKTTFALPDLRGRVPLGVGQGPGLTPRHISETYGAATATLSTASLPAHTHTMTASGANTGLTQNPAANWTLGAASAAGSATTPVEMYAGTSPADPVQSAPTSAAGSASPAAFGVVPPALGLNYIICTQGIFPIRP